MCLGKAFCKHASGLGCKALKLILLNLRGFPDRTVLCPDGRVFFIEFKRAGGRQSPAQKAAERMLRGFGFEYYVCDKIGQAERILDAFIR